MPYHWSPSPPLAPQRLTLWAHQSLSPKGFVGFVGVTAGMLALPLITQIGHPGLWVLLPCLLAALGGLWAALSRNARDRTLREDLTVSVDAVTLTRHGPRGQRQDWQANPHWLRLTLHETGGPVPQYLTLSGGGRVVELGAFLTEAERVALKAEIEQRVWALR
ncbi:MAG: DUF2244 domain-containing protein [Pseudomonadota bacterium]